MDEIVGEPAAKRWKGKARSTGDATEEGEVRFRDAYAAGSAVQQMNNSILQGYQIHVGLDPQATDGTKVVITNMPPGINWQDLKDHFGHVGEVHYANIGRTIQEVGSVRGFGTALPGYPCVGEVRFATKDEAEKGIQMFNGTPYKDQTLVIKPDLSSWHGTKLLVFNVPVGTDWPELKEHFDCAGQILFCGIDCAAKGKGKKGGFNDKGGFTDQGYPPFVGGGPASGSAGQPEGSLGEVRFENPAHAEQAISMLTGSSLDGGVLSISRDDASRDGSRVFVQGVPSGTPRHALKEHFEQVGPVAFCGWKGKGGKGFGKDGYGKDGYGKDGYGKDGYGKDGYGKDGYGKDGYGKDGYGKDGKGYGNFAPQPLQALPMQTGGYHGPPSLQAQVTTTIPLVGEVRYADAAQAERAVAMLHGSQLEGATISVVKDGGCRDGSRVLVLHLPQHIQRHTLQEYFEQYGTVSFCGWKGKGKGKGQQQQFMQPAPAPQSVHPPPQQGDWQMSPRPSAPVVVPPPAPPPAAAGLGEVIFSNNIEAQAAIQMLEGSVLRGSVIALQWPNTSTGTLFVQNLPPGCSAEELKGHFAQVGTVPYVTVHAATAPAPAPMFAQLPPAPPAPPPAPTNWASGGHSPQAVAWAPQAVMAPQVAAHALMDTLRGGYDAAAPMGAVPAWSIAAPVGQPMSAVSMASACAAPMMVAPPGMVQQSVFQGMVSPCAVSPFVQFS